jgi:ubiquitin carboxyl-terminal hydrolase L5
LVHRREVWLSPIPRSSVLRITFSPGAYIFPPTYNLLLNTSRPSDIRASLNNITITTSDAQKRKEKEKNAKQLKKHSKDTAAKPPPAKRAKTTDTKAVKSKLKAKEDASNEDEEETYHFIGYVPACGKVWELDGLKSGPLEVGELPLPAPSPNASSSSSALGAQQPPEEVQNSDWMSVVRPALRMKMEKYGGSATSGTNIRFSLLAIVDDLYQKASDELEFLKREKIVLERKIMQQTEVWKGEEWKGRVCVLLSL